MFKIFLFQILILLGCSSSSFDNTCGNIQPAKMEAWVDLMPGGESSFLFAGILEMELEDTCGISRALEANFYLNQSLGKIHSATALISLAEIVFDADKKKFIAQFGVAPKEKMKAVIVDAELPVNILFDIPCGGKIVEIKFENVSIMKVY